MTAPTDPETTMPDDKTTPPESPAPVPRPSVSAPPVPVAVQVLDRAVDLAAIAAVCWICLSGRLSGELAVVAIGAIAGAQTGLRSVLSARGGPSVGVAGLVLLAGIGVLSAPATAAAAGGVAAAAAGAVGQRGHAQLDMLLLAPLAGLLGAQVIHALPATWRYPVLAALTVAAILLLRSLERTIRPKPRAAERGSARVGVLVVLALGVLLAALPLGLVVSGCGPTREAVMRASPGVPEATGCAAGTQRCDGQVPEVCSSSGRWWPSLPVRPDGTQRECVACVVEDGIAGCAR